MVNSVKIEEYFDWIKQYIIAKNGDIINKCEQATKLMKKKFPELVRVRGHVIIQVPLTGAIRKCQHWWLKTSDNIIIDPTRLQFVNILGYEEWDESKPEPTGKCPNCGEFCYNGDFCCSEQCHNEFVSSLNFPL